MKLRLKEDPREWRKTTLMTAGGLAAVLSLLRWRKHLPLLAWLAILGVLALIAILACVAPRLFRGFYRFSITAGFYMARWMGYAALGLFFALIITPFGVISRLFGYDPLRLKRRGNEESYWQTAKGNGPLDRLF
jgi:hypothetical protein